MNSQGKLTALERPLRTRFAWCLILGALLLTGASAARAQVNPAEIINPRLKAAETTYFQQLIALNRAIGATKFPFPFFLSRYVGVDPQKQPETDTRGLEFVNFHERVLLKITGNYNAAYNADLLTQNQRASRTFQEVVVPILRILPRFVPADVTCDGIGFEISYHVRRQARSYDYEGKESLVVAFDKSDALGSVNTPGDAGWQEILNRSEVYLNGERFGLALGQKDPLNLEALEQPAPSGTPPSATKSPSEARVSVARPEILPGLQNPDVARGTEAASVASVRQSTTADAEQLQVKYQSQLDALGKEGVARFHFVDYAPPSFAIFRRQIVLQFTLRNPSPFDKDTTSIYKRAAQSFDLFLAPQLKAILEKLPAGAEFDGLDITVLNQVGSQPNAPSEAVEFISPLKSLHAFADAEITNQELINQSIVLVNGVRIALNLQQVE